MAGPPPPRLALIADGFTAPVVADRTVAAVRGGVPWVHLRDHAAGSKAFAEAARALAARLCTARPGVCLSVNSRLDVARELSGPLRVGFHAGRHGPSTAVARAQLEPDVLVGASAHDEAEARAARAAADYLFFSPVFPTTSKPGHPGTGVRALRRICQTFPEPAVFALGGLTPRRVPACLDAGAHGVAVLSGILHADAPAGAARSYLNALPTA